MAYEDWTLEGLKHVVEGVAEELGTNMGKVAQPLRVAIVGRAASPGHRRDPAAGRQGRDAAPDRQGVGLHRGARRRRVSIDPAARVRIAPHAGRRRAWAVRGFRRAPRSKSQSGIKDMYIAMVSAECAPIAKAGGLGDVVHGLSRELLALGQEVEVFLPGYDSLRHDLIEGRREVCRDLRVPYFDRWIDCRVDSGEVDGVTCFFIESDSPHRFFQRGRIYGEADDADRFRLLLPRRAGIHADLGQAPGRHPLSRLADRAGARPLVRDLPKLGLTDVRVCYSLHNLGYQGVVGESILRQVGLDPARLMTPDRLQDPANPRRSI
jgi:hypothetical protein